MRIALSICSTAPSSPKTSGKFSSPLLTMFRHYLIAAARNFAHQKLYSFINVVGLAVGLACAILIRLFLRDGLSYDPWIPDSAHLYLVQPTIHLSRPHA